MKNAPADDPELLRRFAGEGADAAFAELVERHVGFVYAAALRQLGGVTHRAEEVTQRVFIDLARKAGSLAGRAEIVGWLYTSTCHAAAKLKRDEQRRQHREHEAYTMQEILSDKTPAETVDWDRLRPVLDSAMHELGERDRAVILLRYFQGRRFAEVGQKLGMSEDGARMRTERALEKLHGLLAQRRITSTTAALGLLLANQPVVAVPAGLAASVTRAALAGVATLGAVSGGGAAGLFFSTMTTKMGMVAALAVAGLGIGAAVYQTKTAQGAHERAETMARERDALREQINGLRQSVAAEAERRGALERAAQTERDAKAAKLAGAFKAAPAVLRDTVLDEIGFTLKQDATGTITLRTAPDDPAERRKQQRAAQSSNLDAAYMALYRQLGWTPEQQEQFRTMMMDRDESMSPIVKKAIAAARAQNPAFDRADQYEIFEATRSQIELEQQADARQIFGEAAGAAVAHFQATAPVRYVATQLASALFDSATPMTATQADQLVEIMAANARGPLGKADLLALNTAAVVAQAQAQGVLSAAQATALPGVVARMQEQERITRERNTMPLAELKAKLGR